MPKRIAAKVVLPVNKREALSQYRDFRQWMAGFKRNMHTAKAHGFAGLLLERIRNEGKTGDYGLNSRDAAEWERGNELRYIHDGASGKVLELMKRYGATVPKARESFARGVMGAMGARGPKLRKSLVEFTKKAKATHLELLLGSAAFESGDPAAIDLGPLDDALSDIFIGAIDEGEDLSTVSVTADTAINRAMSSAMRIKQDQLSPAYAFRRGQEVFGHVEKLLKHDGWKVIAGLPEGLTHTVFITKGKDSAKLLFHLDDGAVHIIADNLGSVGRHFGLRITEGTPPAGGVVIEGAAQIKFPKLLSALHKKASRSAVRFKPGH